MLPASDWTSALRRYLVASFVFHLVWEVVQLPLYTIWSAPIAKQAFAVVHCSVGDVMIAGLGLLVVLAFAGMSDWPRSGSRQVWIFLLIIGVGYTLYSEWLNVSVRLSWAYAPLMPTLPFLGTGLSPLLQWLVVPTCVQRIVLGQWPWEPQAS